MQAFFQAVAMIAASLVDPFELDDWEEAHEWRALYDAYLVWEEVQA